MGNIARDFIKLLKLHFYIFIIMAPVIFALPMMIYFTIEIKMFLIVMNAVSWIDTNIYTVNVYLGTNDTLKT